MLGKCYAENVLGSRSRKGKRGVRGDEEFLLILLASVFIRVYLPERFRTVSPAISAALGLWFIFLFRII
jgi:hypothetical protein